MKDRVCEKIRTKFEALCRKAVNTAYPTVGEEVKHKVKKSMQDIGLETTDAIKFVCLAVILVSGFGKESNISEPTRVVNLTYNEIHAINIFNKEEI